MTIIKSAIGALVLAGVMAAAPARASDASIGDIRIFASRSCPNGWVKTNGALYPVHLAGDEGSPFFVLSIVLARRYGTGNDGRLFRVPNNPQPETDDRRPLVECIAYQGYYPY